MSDQNTSSPPVNNTQDQPAARQAQPASNSGSQGMQFILMITIFALLAIILIFVFKKSNPGSSSAGGSQTDQAVADIESANAIAVRIKSDTDRLISLTSNSEGELKRLRDQVTNADIIQQNNLTQIARLTQENNELREQSLLQGNSANEIEALKLQLDESTRQNNLLRIARDEADQSQLVSTLEGRVKTLNEALEALAQEKKNWVEERANAISQIDYESLNQKVKQLTNEKNELTLLLQDMRSKLDKTRLYVKEEDLNPKAKQLFDELKALNAIQSDELDAAYQAVALKANATVVDRVLFAEGSSRIPSQKEFALKDKLRTTGDNSFFLVVGYASTTGGAKANETLSATRATTTASVVNLLKSQGQDVRAVYLGQTKRFSSTEAAPNQVCEIWEVK